MVRHAWSSMRWWDDVWQDEAMATYLSYLPGPARPGGRVDTAGGWTAFCYREKAGAYLGRRAAGPAAGVLTGARVGTTRCSSRPR